MTTALAIVDAHANLDTHVAATNVPDVGAGYFIQVGSEAAVSCGEGQIALHYAVPERSPVLIELQGRVGVIFHPVGFLVLFRLEGEGQSQNLAVHRHTGGTGLGNDVHAVGGGNVHEVHADPGALGQPNHVPEGEVFDGLGVDEVDVVPVPEAALLGQQIVVHHQFVVFAVDGQHPAVAVDLVHQVAQPAGINPAQGSQAGSLRIGRADVGGEYLHAGETRPRPIRESELWSRGYWRCGRCSGWNSRCTHCPARRS